MMSELSVQVKLLLSEILIANFQKSIATLFSQTNLWTAVHKQYCGVFFAWFQVVWFVQHSIQAETGIGREAKYLRRDIISRATCTTHSQKQTCCQSICYSFPLLCNITLTSRPCSHLQPPSCSPRTPALCVWGHCQNPSVCRREHMAGCSRYCSG